MVQPSLKLVQSVVCKVPLMSDIAVNEMQEAIQVIWLISKTISHASNSG